MQVGRTILITPLYLALSLLLTFGCLRSVRHVDLDKETLYGVRTEESLIVICNAPPTHFMAKVRGDKFTPAKVPNGKLGFFVDGQLIMVQLTKLVNFIESDYHHNDDAYILDKYSDWELQNWVEVVGTKVNKEIYKNNHDARFLFWSIPFPDEFIIDRESSVKRNIYASIVVADKVVTFHSVTRQEDNLQQAYEILSRIAKSFIVRQDHIPSPPIS